MQWLRPTELAAQVASRTTARAVNAHAAAHRQARAELRAALSRTRETIRAPVRPTRGQLAPLSAFGQHATRDSLAPERSGVSR